MKRVDGVLTSTSSWRLGASSGSWHRALHRARGIEQVQGGGCRLASGRAGDVSASRRRVGPRRRLVTPGREVGWVLTAPPVRLAMWSLLAMCAKELTALFLVAHTCWTSGSWGLAPLSRSGAAREHSGCWRWLLESAGSEGSAYEQLARWLRVRLGLRWKW
jgi:hypothetical protein